MKQISEIAIVAALAVGGIIWFVNGSVWHFLPIVLAIAVGAVLVKSIDKL